MGSACCSQRGRVRKIKVSCVINSEPKTAESNDQYLTSHFDDPADAKSIEQFFAKAITCGDIHTSILCLMTSPSCKEAYFTFLKEKSEENKFEQYRNDLLQYCSDSTGTDGNEVMRFGSEWRQQHYLNVQAFTRAPIYKKFRAMESAYVYSAIGHFTELSFRQSLQTRAVNSEYSTNDDVKIKSIISGNEEDSEILVRQSFRSPSFKALKSLKMGAINDITSGSTWIVQFLSIMEDFPFPFSLAKVTKAYGLSMTPIVYVNKSFETFAGINRNSIVHMTMEDILSRPSDDFPKKLEGLVDYYAYWSKGFAGSIGSVSMLSNYSFFMSGGWKQGLCLLTMKPIYNPKGGLAYVATYFATVGSKGCWADADIVNRARRRNSAFLNYLPTFVPEFTEEYRFLLA